MVVVTNLPDSTTVADGGSGVLTVDICDDDDRDDEGLCRGSHRGMIVLVGVMR